MLDKLSKKLLKFLIKHPDIQFSDICNHFPTYTSNQLLFSLEYLQSLNLITGTRTASDMWGISLTNLGKNFFYFGSLKTKEFLFKSLLVPSIISVITTLITLFFKWLLS